jgi:hypothetical protein
MIRKKATVMDPYSRRAPSVWYAPWTEAVCQHCMNALHWEQNKYKINWRLAAGEAVWHLYGLNDPRTACHRYQVVFIDVEIEQRAA